MIPTDVYFFPHGNTAAIAGGAQQYEFQRSWLLLYLAMLEQHGLTADEIKAITFHLPSGDRVYAFRVPSGWSWSVGERHADILEEP